MKVRDKIVWFEPPVDRGAGTLTPAEAAEADEAAALISDLSALLDAGLIEVREHVLGPIRYGVA